VEIAFVASGTAQLGKHFQVCPGPVYQRFGQGLRRGPNPGDGTRDGLQFWRKSGAWPKIL